MSSSRDEDQFQCREDNRFIDLCPTRLAAHTCTVRIRGASDPLAAAVHDAGAAILGFRRNVHRGSSLASSVFLKYVALRTG